MGITKSIIIFFLLIIAISINFKIKISADFLSNRGKIYFKLFNFEVVFYRFFIHKTKLILIDRAHKILKIPLIGATKEEIDEINKLRDLILRKIDIRYFETSLFFGIDGEPLITSMIIEVYDIVVKCFMDFLKGVKKQSKLYVKTNPVFDKTKIVFNLNTCFYISIFDLLWGIIESRTINNSGENFIWKNQQQNKQE